MTQHTPGPWTVVTGDWDDDGNARYTLDGIKLVSATDARLIAAAPELLEALKSVMEMMDDEIKTSSDAELAFGLSDPECPDHVKVELACVIACRAAIAKAGGEA